MSISAAERTLIYMGYLSGDYACDIPRLQELADIMDHRDRLTGLNLEEETVRTLAKEALVMCKSRIEYAGACAVMDRESA